MKKHVIFSAVQEFSRKIITNLFRNISISFEIKKMAKFLRNPTCTKFSMTFRAGNSDEISIYVPADFREKI